jgi:hypothetical protein
MRRYLVIGIVVLLAALWTGSAAAIPPERFVFFESTAVFNNSPFCGDATIVVHDVGRITLAEFFNPDGTPKAFTVHDAAITETLTNLDTGATLTTFYSNFVNDQYRIDRRTGAITETLSFSGLNAIIRDPNGKPTVVTAGRATLTYLVTFDAAGNPVFTPTGVTETPNMEHLTQILCA